MSVLGSLVFPRKLIVKTTRPKAKKQASSMTSLVRIFWMKLIRLDEFRLCDFDPFFVPVFFCTILYEYKVGNDKLMSLFTYCGSF